MAAKATVYDRLMAAFFSRDEAAIRAAAQDAGVALGEPGQNVGGGGPGGTALPDAGGEKAITININPSANDPNALAIMNSGDEAADLRGKAPAKDAVTDALDKMTNTLAGIDARLVALENGKSAGKDAAAENKDGKVEKEGTEGKEGKTGDAATADSTDLNLVFADVIARAEVLYPGAKLPTFDSAKPRTQTVDAMCALRRTALAGANPDIVKPLLAGRDMSKMTCDAVSIVFDGAVELARIAHNRQYARPLSGNGAGISNTPRTPAELNQANRDFWAGKGSK